MSISISDVIKAFSEPIRRVSKLLFTKKSDQILRKVRRFRKGNPNHPQIKQYEEFMGDRVIDIDLEKETGMCLILKQHRILKKMILKYNGAFNYKHCKVAIGCFEFGKNDFRVKEFSKLRRVWEYSLFYLSIGCMLMVPARIFLHLYHTIFTHGYELSKNDSILGIIWLIGLYSISMIFLWPTREFFVAEKIRRVINNVSTD